MSENDDYNNVKSRSWTILIILALIWGSSFILIKRGLFDSSGSVLFSPQHVGALRIVLAGLSLIVFVIPSLQSLSLRDYFWLIIVGLIGNTIPAFFFAIAETKVDSAVAGMFNSTTPIFAFLIAMIVYKTKFSKLNILGLLIGFIGAIGLIVFGNEMVFNLDYHSLLLIIAAMCYGISLNVIKMKLKKVSPLAITGVSLGILAIPMSIYLLNTGFIEVIYSKSEGFRGLGYIALLSVVGTSLALVIFNYLVKKESILFASSVTYLIPIVAITWGVIDGEKLIFGQVLMILVILSGVFLTNKKDGA